MVAEIYASFVGALIGAPVGAWATYRYARTLADREAHRLAASVLRASFAPLLSSIRFNQSQSQVELRALLDSGISQHEVEMQKFRFHVRSADLPAYDAACEDFQSTARIRALNYSASDFPHKVIETKVNAVLLFSRV